MLTALPAPTTTNMPTKMKKMPKGMSRSLKNGNGQRSRQRRIADPHEDADGNAGNGELRQQPHLARKALGRRLGDLEEIVIKADGAETQRHEQHGPDIEIAQVGPQQRGNEDARQDHQPAHGRRALLFDDVALRPVAADRLAAALLHLEQRNDARPEQEDEQQVRSGRRRRSASSDSGTR